MSRTTNKKEKDDERGVEQRLLKQRIVLLFEEVNETSASEVVQSIIILDSINRRPIKLLINSIGGAISDGLAVIDTMKAVRSPIETFIVGTAMSMAAIISI